MHSLPHLAVLLGPRIVRPDGPTWTELKLLVYVMEWPRRLKSRAEYRTGLTLIDQGPVYALARLGHSDTPIRGTEPHQPWWESMVDLWAANLDVVIWIDAPNQVLWERVNQRSRAHEIKGQSYSIAMAYIDRYRAAYEPILRSIERHEGTRVLRYDSSRWQPVEMAADALERLSGNAPPRRRPRSGGKRS